MRSQCKKCPWRKDVDPYEIPDGYSRNLHCGLAGTIAEPGAMPHSVKVRCTLRIMACHESKVGKDSMRRLARKSTWRREQHTATDCGDAGYIAR